MPGTPDQSVAAVIRLTLLQFWKKGIGCAVLSAPTRTKDRHKRTARNATRAYAPRVERLRFMRPRLFCRNCQPVGKKESVAASYVNYATRAGIANAGTAMRMVGVQKYQSARHEACEVSAGRLLADDRGWEVCGPVSVRRGHRLRFETAPVDPVLLHLVIEDAPCRAQKPRGLRAVPASALESLLERFLFDGLKHFLERERQRRARSLCGLECRGQVIRVQHVGVAHDHRALDCVRELAHVAGPMVA